MQLLIKVANQNNNPNMPSASNDSPANKAMRARASKIKAEAKKRKSLAKSRPEGREYKVIPPQ